MQVSLHSSPSLNDSTAPYRSEGVKLLETFIPRANAYGGARNFVLPDHLNVSRLSPYIRYRLLTEREVVRTILRQHPYESVEKFIQEVCWRTYWKGYLEGRPEIWSRYRRDLTGFSDRLDHETSQRLGRARAGQTGIDCFDAWVRELKETGWLHNHARMWFASIWIFTLKLPWQLGAAFFLEHLLDGDPAVNTLSWRWVAGLHTPGKHYLARAENIRKYTNERYNPEGQLDETAEALAPDPGIPVCPLPEVSSLKAIHFPSLSCCPAGLLVTPDDLRPEQGELAETPFSSICVLSGRDVLDRINASRKVRAFCAGAVEDAGERLCAHWDGKIIECRHSIIPMVGKASASNVGRGERMRVYSGAVGEWVDSVLTWARNENLKSVWMLRPTVGPWSEAVGPLQEKLSASGIHLLMYRRRWDSLHWPHATKGYFRFNEGLKDRVEQAVQRD